jgi:transposase-like protein
MLKTQMSEAASCPLCSTAAMRDTLSGGDGYRYRCAACGGMFEFGANSQARADRGQLHPDIAPSVRALLAERKVPRVEFTAGEFSVRIVQD